MTSEIIVFQPPEQKEVSLTKSERELLYEDLEKYSQLDSHHFPAFYDMETEDIESTIIESTIASVMLKYIIKYCYPIILDIPKLNLRIRKRKTKNIVEKEVVIKDYFFTMQFPQETPGFTKGGKSIILVPGVSYRVIGIKIPKKIRTSRDKSVPNFLSMTHTLLVSIMGSYGLKDFQNKSFFQERKGFLHYSSPDVDLLGQIIIFKSNEDALETINKFISVIQSMEAYYEKNLNSIYTSLKFTPFSQFMKIMLDKNAFPKYNEDFLKKIEETNEIKRMREIYPGKLPDTEFRFLYSLDKSKIFNTYQKIRILGIGHNKSQSILDEIIQENENFQNTQLQKKMRSESYLEFAKKQTIALDKFNVEDLTKLTKEQRKVVELQYENLKKIEKGTKEMSESLKAAASLDISVDNLQYEDVRKNLNKVKSLLDKPNQKLTEQNELLKDKQGTHFICPHTVARAEKIIEASKFIRTNPDKLTKIRDHIIEEFSLPDITLGYFCRVCGALLAEQDEEKIIQFLDGQRVGFIPQIDDRQSMIWKEVAYIISTFVKFKDAVNVKKIVTSIAHSISGEIAVIETKLTRVRTNNNDSIKDMLRIYITVYAYAVVIQMIYLNYGKITFITKESRRGGAESPKIKFRRRQKIEVMGEDSCGSDASSEEESPFVLGAKMEKKVRKEKRIKRTLQKEDKKRLQNIFRTALELIIRSKNALLNKLSNISVDNIKPLLIKAYQWVVNLKQSVDSSNMVREPNTAYFLGLDPIYEYIWFAHNMKHFSEGKKDVLNLADIKRYLGRSLTQIEEDYEQGKTIYETARSVDPWGKTLKAKYDHGSFMFLFDYTKNKLYNFDIVPMSNKILEFNKKYEFLQEISKKMEQDVILQNMNPNIHYELIEDLVKKYNDFSKINIADYYCHDGKKHKFDIFVYSKVLPSGVLDQKDFMELKVGEIKKWLSNEDKTNINKFKNYHFIDEKCSNCSTYLSHIKKDDTISKKLAKQDEFRAFYDYFENRCPEGNLHDYKIDAKKNVEKCSKCGFKESLMVTLDKEYYKKYLKNYEDILDDQKSFDKEFMSEFKEMSNKYEIKLTKYPEWKINNKEILHLSRSMNIKYNILVNLGLNEGRKFENIEKEKENPHINSTVEEDILRNQYLHDYCLWLLRSYYMIKNYNIIYDIPQELKDIIENQRKIGNIQELKKLLPDIYDKFNEKYQYYFHRLKPKLLSNFLLDYLCSFLNKVVKALENTPFMSLGGEFVKYIINEIIKSEKNVSQPPPLSLIIDKGSAGGPPADDFVAGDEYYDATDPEDGIQSLDDIGETSNGDDFARGDLDFDMSEGMSDNFDETNYVDNLS